jgi:hypothetical protein
MKHKTVLKSTRAFVMLILFGFILSNIVSAQNDPKVVIQMKKGDKIKNVNEGKKVRVWYEGEKYAGYIDSIGVENLYMDGKAFQIEKIEKIGIKYKGTIITGAIVGTAGVLFGALGTYMIIDGTRSGDLGGLLVVVFGVMIDAVSVPVIVVGSTVAFIGKKYKKDKGWEFKAVQLE